MGSALELIKSPWQFAVHVGTDLLVNGVSIYKEINAAVDDWKAAKWGAFGEDVGAALAQVPIGDLSKQQLMATHHHTQAEVASFQAKKEELAVDIANLEELMALQDEAVLAVLVTQGSGPVDME